MIVYDADGKRIMTSFPVRVVSVEVFRKHRRDRFGHPLDDPMFMWEPGGMGFLWECPGCGHAWHGQIGDASVSGWSDPRWVNSGTAEAPTMTPSFGCNLWHNGNCPIGHFWMRAGVLEPA